MNGLRLLPAALLAVCCAAPAAAETGAEIYRVYCTQCHGTQGDGRGINASAMEVLPRAHIDPVEMGARQDADLTKVIREGGKAINKSVLMPSWGHNLSAEQIEKVVRHLRTLCCEGKP
jgi:cytochrome c oxidase cbb3-type subunit 3